MTYKRMQIIFFVLILFSAGCLKAPDTDNDGYRDPVDKFPMDPYDWDDSDNDGVGDNAEKDAGTNPHSSDTDGDGYPDGADLDPLDAKIGLDTDGDGYHDAIDVFPHNVSEWADTDGDGYGDNSDRYPEDPLYHTSMLKRLNNFSYIETELRFIFENESEGAEYTFEFTNNESFGGNFTLTIDSCNAKDRMTDECEPGTKRSSSIEFYLGPMMTKDVKITLFSKYVGRHYTFRKWVNVIPPEVEQPV